MILVLAFLVGTVPPPKPVGPPPLVVGPQPRVVVPLVPAPRFEAPAAPCRPGGLIRRFR